MPISMPFANTPHAKAHRWLKSMGLREEAVLPAFGRNGETFIQFARVRDGAL